MSLPLRSLQVTGPLAALALLAVVAGCANESAEPRPEICSPRSTEPPCTDAEMGLEYRTALLSHCGVDWAYIDGRYWVIEPSQPGGPNEIYGTVQLVAHDELTFRGDAGERYAFEPAGRSYRPPPCY